MEKIDFQNMKFESNFLKSAKYHIGSCGNSTPKLKSKLWKLKSKVWKVSESEKQIVENGKLWKIWEQVVENLRASCGKFGSNLWK